LSVITNLQTTAANTPGNDLSPEIKTFYHRKLLTRLRPQLVYSQFGQKVKIPKGNSKTVEFRRFDTLTPAGGYTNNQFQLTEGVTPGGQNISVSTVSATVVQHGSYIAITDVLELVAFDPILDQASELLGEQAGEYVDLLVREVLMGGTNVFYAFATKFNADSELVRDTATAQPTSRVTVGKAHSMSVDTIRAAKRVMQRNKVKPYKGDKTTVAGRGEFVLVIHPDAVFDLEGNKKWVDVKKYKDTDGSYDGEVGMIYGVRIIMTEVAKVWAAAGAAGADVYGALMIGADAFGIVDIAGSGNVDYIFKPKGSGGTEDPLDQRSTTAWKCMFTTVILQPLALLRIEHGFTG
jgi:N4-gp56 family major capsid protein